jgi:hypothetical protein
VALSLGVKQPGHEADHSPPSSSEVKECVQLWRGVQLKKKALGQLYLLPFTKILVRIQQNGWDFMSGDRSLWRWILYSNLKFYHNQFYSVFTMYI